MGGRTGPQTLWFDGSGQNHRTGVGGRREWVCCGDAAWALSSTPVPIHPVRMSGEGAPSSAPSSRGRLPLREAAESTGGGTELEREGPWGQKGTGCLMAPLRRGLHLGLCSDWRWRDGRKAAPAALGVTHQHTPGSARTTCGLAGKSGRRCPRAGSQGCTGTPRCPGS